MEAEEVVDFSGTYCMRFALQLSYHYCDVTFPDGFYFVSRSGLLIPMFNGRKCFPVLPNVYNGPNDVDIFMIYICLENREKLPLRKLVDYFITSTFINSYSCSRYMSFMIGNLKDSEPMNGEHFKHRLINLSNKIANESDPLFIYQSIVGDIRKNKEVMVLDPNS